jgi:hypothetical protein
MAPWFPIRLSSNLLTILTMDGSLRNPFDYKPRFQRDDGALLEEESAPMGKY